MQAIQRVSGIGSKRPFTSSSAAYNIDSFNESELQASTHHITVRFARLSYLLSTSAHIMAPTRP